MAMDSSLEVAALQARLTTAALGRTYEPHEICGSTNDLCAERARQGAPEGLVVLADRQTGGKGQKGRRWLSAGGQNLTFSLLLRPATTAAALPPLTLLAGVAVARALLPTGIRPRLKWPNDVLVDAPGGARKLCGILTEMATMRDEVKHVVVGIGINVNQTDFDPEVASLATSLRQLTGQTHDRAALLAGILVAFEGIYVDTLASGTSSVLAAWRSFAGLPRACQVTRPSGTLSGTAIDVDAAGALLLESEAGIHRVRSGDVST